MQIIYDGIFSMKRDTLKELRHTFTTQAKECGISDEIVKIWTARSLQYLPARVDTHFTLECMKEKAERLIFEVPFPKNPEDKK